jgi:hypothetical protein
MADARDRIEEWRTDYNRDPPHTALGGLTPSAFANQADEGGDLHRPWTTNRVRNNMAQSHTLGRTTSQGADQQAGVSFLPESRCKLSLPL